ncbi:hypothetical protein BY996DRAFT_6430623 [Phakopsora pachyrhizi]|nr:hypothetical protein BY996DRAFT_6430623 [Phakopsora pachyrhizi]
MNKLISLPYRLDFSDPIGQPVEDYSSLSLNLSNLDAGYAIAASQNLNSHGPRSNIGNHVSQRRALQPMTNNNEHHIQSEYCSRASSPSLNRVYNHNSARMPLSPAESFSQMLEKNQQLVPNPEPVVGQKRKSRPLEAPEDFSSKSRRSSLTPDYTPLLPAPSMSPDSGHHRMTTVLCLHASVAQKSYGQEKRFLCPPPLVRITGPYRLLKKAHRPVLSMSILNEQGEQHLCQTSYIGEDDTNVHFKSLHISGAAKKAKHVTLELSIHPPTQNPAHPTHNNGPDIEDLAPPFATFRSTECNIISKPSKKTAKARNTQSCIFNGSTICLFNRINSQTVRTKYLCVQNGMLAARAAQWSAFIIKVVRRAEEPGVDGTPPITAKTLLSSNIPGADRTVTYGSEVELIDFVTGVSSGPLIVRKVEKNKVQKDATGPVSQMQKLAFCQINRTDGSTLYITALDGISTPRPVPNCSDEHVGLGSNIQSENLDYSRLPIGLNQSVISPTPQRLHMLQLQPPRAVLPPEERGGMTLDEIDDSVAWTVIGVAHFSYTFFDLSHHYPQIPLIPITPFPALTSRPTIDLSSLTMTIKITGFFDSQVRVMEVWLGPLGALTTTVLSTSGITLGPGIKDEEGGVNSSGSNGVMIQMARELGGDIQAGRGARQETTLLVNMPSLESIYWTLHRSQMPPDVVVAMEDANGKVDQGSSGGADKAINNSDLFSGSKHIPALPITLIRADGMSFMMANSICLSKAPDIDLKSSNEATAVASEERDEKRICVLKVI